jgi:hypothetical protein
MEMPHRSRFTRLVLACLVTLLAAACHELPEQGVKPFAGKNEAELYVGSRFHGNKADFEAALAKRNQYQNEYVRMDK